MKEKREKNRWELNVEIKDRNECWSRYVHYITANTLLLLGIVKQGACTLIL